MHLPLSSKELYNFMIDIFFVIIIVSYLSLERIYGINSGLFKQCISLNYFESKDTNIINF